MLRNLASARGAYRALAILAIAVFAMRALVPAGYMLAPGQDGNTISVQICSGHGPLYALLDLETGEITTPTDQPQDAGPSHDSDPDAQAPCAFAGGGAFAVLGPAILPPEILPVSTASVLAPDSRGPPAGAALSPITARGPPATA